MGTKSKGKMQSSNNISNDTNFFMMNGMCEHTSRNQFTVDVIIPTYRPDHKFELLMKRLKKQTVQPKNIIIINTIPNVFSVEEARKEQGEFFAKCEKNDSVTMIHIQESEFDHGRTRGYGASLSNADLLLFMTQDAIPADEFVIEELMRSFQDSKVAAAYARQLPMTNADEIESFTRTFNYPAHSIVKSRADIDTLGIKTFFCSNVCAMYRSDVYRHLGGFVSKTIFNEDMIYAEKLIRNQYKIAYVAEAKVFHSHHYSYRAQFQRNFDLAVSHAQYPNVFSQMKSETEGIKLVRMTANHLMKRHSYIKLVDLIIVSGCKYLGYFFGKRYKKLPKRLVLRWSMNRNYWNDYDEERCEG